MTSDDHLAELNPAACPTVESLNVIGTQWRLNVLYDLQDGEKRFNELKESTGASSRTLSQTLDTLADYGLVTERSERADPIAVYYSLTEKGEALESVFAEFDAWAREHMDVAEPDTE
ncbi:DNA-binding transcriptional regulator, HxlR family [Halovenus aranensis]|jgi:DNA-binding HxlR family transcriptional regulator|uniref:DNA-binding transcriptional regulator, HxlR family n=1 Tax=Halovenus aranensis TaxID=890420 RepID=A0A1G8RX46_9EURY|nr:helix-turn-helix domain-containing protein [Halovenus aranensis]SDJ21584.1 DNA-binding transcriptional regulator, HxlR family [Halovenus aranensis]